MAALGGNIQTAANARKLHGKIFQSAERARGFGKLRLSRPRALHGPAVKRSDGAKRLRKRHKNPSRESQSSDERASESSKVSVAAGKRRAMSRKSAAMGKCPSNSAACASREPSLL